MDIATIIGILGALSIVIWAVMLGGDFSLFFDLAGFMIVVGGSCLVVLSKFGLHQFLGALKVGLNAFLFEAQDTKKLIRKSVELANLARKNGILALEDVKIDNVFFRKGLQYLVDGFDGEQFRGLLLKDLNETLARHLQGQRIFRALGEISPAMGMIGTLIGLVQMMSAMDDPKRIGPAMAVALLTTLYGAIIANLIAFPIAEKLALRSEEEKHAKLLIIDALMSIQDGHNPKLLEEFLKIYLPGSQRNNTVAKPTKAKV